MNKPSTSLSSGCAVCRHLGPACPGRDLAEQGQACDQYERYGDFLARELASVNRQYVLHQIAGLGLAVALGLGMTWAIHAFA